MERIESVGTGVITTSGLAEFKAVLERARAQLGETRAELDAVRRREQKSVSSYLSWQRGWLFRRLWKRKFAAMQVAAEEDTARRVELEEQEKLSHLNLQLEIPDNVSRSFARLVDDFSVVARAERIWDTVSHRVANRAVERTTATRIVERKQVSFSRANCEVIDFERTVPRLANANGGDLFLFPLFIVYFVDATSFGLLEYKDVEFTCTSTRFQEEELVPSDSQTVGPTWAKANKDGSPDRRFKDNYEIPVVEYGKLTMISKSGLNEEYMVSNVSALQALGRAWRSHCDQLRR